MSLASLLWRKKMNYYNQRDYAHVPYPSPSLPKATVKSGGCGVVCASMIVENLTGRSFPPEESACYAIRNGARVSGGTDMRVLSRAVGRDFGMNIFTTNDENELIRRLNAGGMAIANVGGNRAGYTGVFSDAGHYVVAAGIKPDGRVIVLDPCLYEGKFNKAGRREKVSVSGNEVWCAPTVLHQDTFTRNPNYYLFERTVNVDKIKDVLVTVGEKKVNAKLIGSTTYVELRPLVDALNEKLHFEVTWTQEDGAGVV